MKINVFFFLFGLFLMSSIASMAQNNTLNFAYDDNGNRILRELVFEEIRNVESFNKENALTVNTNNLLDTLDIKLFPNPTYGQFHIQITDALPDTPIKAVLMTVSGNIISEKLVTSDRMEFDLSNQADGIYFLQLLLSENNPFFRISKFGSREYQHLQCETKALRNPTRTIIFATEMKGRSYESHSKQRGLQIHILGTSGLQIRWNGTPVGY